VTHVLQEPPVGWSGPTGVLSPDVLEKVIPEAERAGVFLVCGPKPMTDAVQRSLRGWGVPLRRIRTELFDMA
jgi:predicted ferric reductase